jgi:DNA-binding response OmpR family regulator
VPIIVVGEGGEPQMAEALFRGADAFLRYPDEPARLRSRVRAILRPRSSRRPANKKEEKKDDPSIKDTSFLACRSFAPAAAPAF